MAIDWNIGLGYLTKGITQNMFKGCLQSSFNTYGRSPAFQGFPHRLPTQPSLKTHTVQCASHALDKSGGSYRLLVC